MQEVHPELECQGMMPKNEINSPSIEEGNAGSLMSGGGVLKKGPWTSAEDAILVDYVKKHGEGNWNAVQKHSGLSRCGKSCRLRWANHLRPNLKKGAFTAEEEQLIIELHARMGNKWARMAAHLPGRTDNEIKNYWNTRIKRRQRAGLPLYPPSLCFQASNDNQENTSPTEFSCHNQRRNEQTIVVTDNFYNTLKADAGDLSYAPPFAEISGFGTQQFGFETPLTNHAKRLRESETLLPGFNGSFTKGLPALEQLSDSSAKVHKTLGLGFSYDLDRNCTDVLPFEDALAARGSHAFSNGNLPASKPPSGASKLELPSLQFPKVDPPNWFALPSTPLEAFETYLQPLPAGKPVKLDCGSIRNSGLLEELLHESEVLCNAKNQPSEKSSNCSTPMLCSAVEGSTPGVCVTPWEEYKDPISPLGQSAASVFSESATPATGNLFNNFGPSKAVPDVNLVQANAGHCLTANAGEKETLMEDISRPDALLGTDWLEESSEATNNRSVLNEALATLFGEDIETEFKHAPGGASSSSDHGAELVSCPWNNMPLAFQISEIP